jgi:predicted PurR-regulated permease PerM
MNRAGDGGRRAALFLVAVAVAVLLVGVSPIAAGLVAAPALAVVCRPLHQSLANHVGSRVAAVVVVVVVWIGVVVPGVWLATVAIQQVPGALSEVHRAADRLRSEPMPFAVTNADTLIAQVGAKSVGWIPAAIGPALGSVGHALVDLSIALLGLFFLLATGDTAWRAVRRRLPFSAEGSEELKRVFVDVTRATLLGSVASAALQGASIGIGLRLIGNGAPAFWGVVGGFATLVPVVGNAIVWVPAVIAPLMRRDFGAALVMITCGKLIPALLDRLVRSSISRRVGDTHPMVTLVGILAGVRLIGPVGVVIGPTLIRCAMELALLFEREYGLPWADATLE